MLGCEEAMGVSHRRGVLVRQGDKLLVGCRDQTNANWRRGCQGRTAWDALEAGRVQVGLAL